MKESEYKNIEDLIARFLAAETTEAEERKLQEYLCGLQEVPPEWQDIAIMMHGFRAESQAPKSVPNANKSSKKAIVKILAWAAAAIVVVALMIPLLVKNNGLDNEYPSIAELVGECDFTTPLPCHSDDECAQMRFLMAVSSIKDPELRNELMDLAVEFDLKELNREADEYVEKMLNKSSNL